MELRTGMGQPHGRLVGPSESGVFPGLQEREATVSGSMYCPLHLSTTLPGFYHFQVGVV